MEKYIICDWANSRPFGWKTFPDFETANDYLEAYIGKKHGYPENDDQFAHYQEIKEEYRIRKYSEAKRTWL
jgi:hypothetical protein